MTWKTKYFRFYLATQLFTKSVFCNKKVRFNLTKIGSLTESRFINLKVGKQQVKIYFNEDINVNLNDQETMQDFMDHQGINL